MAADDNRATNAILAATHHVYKRAGIVYLSVVILLAVTYPLVISTDIPWNEVSLIILFCGLESVLTYFCHGKYRILLRAEGKNYVLNNLSLVCKGFRCRRQGEIIKTI